MDGVARLVEASGKLLGTLAWPLLVLTVALLFQAEIRSFLVSLDTASVKFGDGEILVTRVKGRAAAALTGATTAKAVQAGETPHPSQAVDFVQSALAAVASVTGRTLRRLGQLSVL